VATGLRSPGPVSPDLREAVLRDLSDLSVDTNQRTVADHPAAAVLLRTARSSAAERVEFLLAFSGSKAVTALLS